MSYGSINYGGTMGALTVSELASDTTIELPDPLIDWLPYHYKKYLPTWHLVLSYRTD